MHPHRRRPPELRSKIEIDLDLTDRGLTNYPGTYLVHLGSVY